jgi:hypothetical protein
MATRLQNSVITEARVMDASKLLSTLKSAMGHIISLLTCSETLLMEELFINWLSNGIKLQQQAALFASPYCVKYIDVMEQIFALFVGKT